MSHKHLLVQSEAGEKILHGATLTEVPEPKGEPALHAEET